MTYGDNTGGGDAYFGVRTTRTAGSERSTRGIPRPTDLLVPRASLINVQLFHNRLANSKSGSERRESSGFTFRGVRELRGPTRRAGGRLGCRSAWSRALEMLTECARSSESEDRFRGEDVTLKPRRIGNQNIVWRLEQRRVDSSPPGTHWYKVRRLHQNVVPNFTVVNVEKPPGFLRKFSPDGRYFIAFSADQTSLEIYRYQGCQAAEKLLQGFSGDVLVNGAVPRATEVCARLFDCFFQLVHCTSVAPPGEHLNRECSLFTDDGRHVIVGSAAYHPDEQQPLFYEVYRNNESVTPNPKSPLEDYSLHVVELKSGRLCDSRRFRCDKIFLSHNQGLYLYRSVLAVLSVQQQTIHVFQITPEGMFLDVRSIGRFCYEDDLLTLSAVYPAILCPGSTQTVTRPFREPTINSLKHRLLVHLWRRTEHEGGPTARRIFFRHFEQLRRLRMWKMQLLDEVHLLIKYASEDVVTLKVTDPSQPSFFVVYNMVTTEVLDVFENTSEELLELLESFCDLFRNAAPYSQPMQFLCSASCNIYARQIQRRFKHTIVNAKYGGQTEAVKRLLAQLPISAQSYSSSPYLDLALFSYDDKWVSVMERPKACGDHPIRFYARDSGLLKFKIQAGMLGRPIPPSARRLVAFTFHPSEPFAISVQRTNAEYVVNFHLRHVCTKD